MPRRNITFSQHHYYHIYNRGAGRHDLFIERDNYLYVLRQTKTVCSALNLTVIAYCLMTNHYHFLLRQDGETPAGDFPGRVFGGYSRAVNRRYGWTGTLFEGRYQARHVDNDTYLSHLCRYIHANPVLAGLVRRPDDWPYANYLEWIGRRAGDLVDHEFITENFGSPANYAQSVAEFIEMKQMPDTLSYLGNF